MLKYVHLEQEKCPLFGGSVTFLFFGVIQQTGYLRIPTFHELLIFSIFGSFGARKVPGKFRDPNQGNVDILLEI